MIGRCQSVMASIHPSFFVARAAADQATIVNHERHDERIERDREVHQAVEAGAIKIDN